MSDGGQIFCGGHGCNPSFSCVEVTPICFLDWRYDGGPDLLPSTWYLSSGSESEWFPNRWVRGCFTMVFRTIVYLRWSGLGSTTYTHPRPRCLFLSGETGGFSFLMVKTNGFLPSWGLERVEAGFLPSFLGLCGVQMASFLPVWVRIHNRFY